MTAAPTFKPLALRCGACGDVWDARQPSGVAAAIWLAAMKALRCPRCGAGHEQLVIRHAVLEIDETAPTPEVKARL